MKICFVASAKKGLTLHRLVGGTCCAPACERFRWQTGVSVLLLGGAIALVKFVREGGTICIQRSRKLRM